jgi:truncated hemoglobin YjbI
LPSNVCRDRPRNSGRQPRSRLRRATSKPAFAGRVTGLYEHAGGKRRCTLEELAYSKVLADPVLRRLFMERRPDHVDQLTWFTAESFGGPDRFTRELGFQHVIDAHRHLKITDEQASDSSSSTSGTAHRSGVPPRRAPPEGGALASRPTAQDEAAAAASSCASHRFVCVITSDSPPFVFLHRAALFRYRARQATSRRRGSGPSPMGHGCGLRPFRPGPRRRL